MKNINKDILRYARSEYSKNWVDMPAQLPLFELRVSLKTIMSIIKQFDISVEELYNIVEDISVSFKKN